MPGTILPWEIFQLLNVCLAFSWQVLFGNPTTEVASDSQGDLLRTSANSLLTQPQGKAQEAIHLLALGRPSGVQQTCSSTGLELVLGRDTLGAPLHDGSL